MHTYKKIIIISSAASLLIFLAWFSFKNKDSAPSQNKIAQHDKHSIPEIQKQELKKEELQTSPHQSEALIPKKETASPDIQEKNKQEAQPKKPELTCKKVSYALNDRVPANMRENIQNYKSVVPIPLDQSRMENSLCIRVNGTPVAYKKMKSKKNSVVIESGVTASSSIEVSYCSGKGNCPLQCIIPKDDFLISLGGDSENNELDSLGSDTVSWTKDQKMSAEEQELKNNAKEIKEIFAIGSEQDSKIFNGWTIKKESDSGCSHTSQQQVSQR